MIAQPVKCSSCLVALKIQIVKMQQSFKNSLPHIIAHFNEQLFDLYAPDRFCEMQTVLLSLSLSPSGVKGLMAG